MGIGGFGSFLGGFGSGLSQGMSNEQNMQMRKLAMDQMNRQLEQQREAGKGLANMPSAPAPYNVDPNQQGATAGPGSSHTTGYAGLEPGFQQNLQGLLGRWNQLHPDIQAHIISAYRSPGYQAGLSGYHAQPGMSAHQYGAAADIGGLSRGQLAELGGMAPNYGVYWGGNWRRPDYPHFQAYPGAQQREDWKQQHYNWLRSQ